MSPKETMKKSDSTSPVQPNANIPKSTEPETKHNVRTKIESANPNAEPLAPPPRPAPVANTPDYFSVSHNLNAETNPFDFSFAGSGGPQSGGVQTPGGTKLPSVAALTSPALPHYWTSSAGLRSGPLSPAMLAGPAKDDYFGDSFHLHPGSSHPRPRESDMRTVTPGDRTGLTPGGGGSMFPVTPGGTSIFNPLVSGGVTPGTLDFHRTAIAMKKGREMSDEAGHLANLPSQPPDVVMNGMDVKPPQFRLQENETNDAANGLFLLANAHNAPQQTNHYAIAPQSLVHAQPMPMVSQPQETSPLMDRSNGGGSVSTNSAHGHSEGSDEDQSRPLPRGKNKRNTSQDNQTNGRRKPSGDQAKPPPAKKSKANGGMSMSMEPPSEDEEPDLSKDEFTANGRKMTDEEKRKNFLERNRVAALKCRQRKKQWLANLQQKVEMYSLENDTLNATISQLRDELVNLKTLLLAHKECSVTHGQGLNPGSLQQLVDGFSNPHLNPYGMAMNQQQQHQQHHHHHQQQQQQLMANPVYQRRES